MRELKFRAWDKEEKLFTYDIQNVYDCDIHEELKDKYCGYDSFGQILSDDNFVVEQFIGMEDKHGEEIYEGDIIKSESGDIGFVEYDQGTLSFEIINKNMVTFNISSSVVIGNIHENPELLT